MTTPTATCPLRHRTPTAATPGLRICPGHLDQLHEDLTDIATLTTLLDDMAQPSPNTGNRRGIPVHPTAPAVLDAIAATDPRTQPDGGDQLVSITAILTGWTTHLTSHRRLATRPTTLTDAAHLLATHLDWYAASNHIETLTHDLGAAAHLLRHLAGEHQQPIGRHHAPHPNHPERDCNGRLYPLPWQFGVHCAECGETYDGHTELRRLGLVLTAR